MKYLFIDDELYARKALAKRVAGIVGQEHCEIYEAEDVPTAKIMLQKIHFDIIFLDICMPGENGLALVEYLIVSNLAYEVVIVSGFAEFEYARKALELGVRHYLLKPAEEERLREILVTSMEQKSRNDMKKLSALAQDVQNSLYQSGEIKDFPFQAERYFALVIQGKAQLDHSLLGELVESLSGIFEEKFGCTINPMTPLELVAVCGMKEDMEDQVKAHLIRMRELGQCYNEELYMGVGSAYSNVEKLAESFQEAHSALNNRIVDRWNKVFFYMEERVKPLKDHEFTYFEDALKKRDKDGAKLILKRMFKTYIEENTHFSQLQYMYHKIAGCLQEYEFSGLDSKPCVLIKSINGFSSIYDILEYFVEVIDFILSASVRQEVNPIQDVLDYIHEYYYDFISLEVLARERYYMNPKYFGKLFKDYAGQSFSKYLTSVRMEKALDYLEAENYSIHQVSYMCGYSSVSHFIQTFKKFYGETPARWKEQNSNGLM